MIFLKDVAASSLTLVWLTFELISSVDSSLDCFSCLNVRNIEDCHAIKTCSDSQMCYTEKYLLDGNDMFTLGCREKVFCVGLDQTNLFGRRQAEDSSTCLQCCALHGCNKYLCPVKFTAAPPPVDGKWSNWGQWGDCSPSCGIGLHFRFRDCNNPPPSFNGRLCLGDAKDVAICNNKPCTDSPNTPPGIPVVTTVDPPSTTDPPKSTSSPHTVTHYHDQYTTSSTSHYVTADLTQAPGGCKDLVDCSSYYRPDACHGIYSAWAHRFCPVHCGFCPTASPVPCIDTIKNCHEYEADVCTKEAFWQWREAHCRKFCRLC